MIGATNDRALEAMLAVVLKVGTLIASAVIGAGLAVQWLALPALSHDATATRGMPIVEAGIALFLLLPCLRVLLMLIVFARERDYGFGAVAALVLLIIAIAFAVGDLTRPASGHDRPRAGANTVLTHAFPPSILCTGRYTSIDCGVQRQMAVRIAPNTGDVARRSRVIYLTPAARPAIGRSAEGRIRQPADLRLDPSGHVMPAHTARVRDDANAVRTGRTIQAMPAI